MLCLRFDGKHFMPYVYIHVIFIFEKCGTARGKIVNMMQVTA